jgi:hypothetical protein
MIRTTAIGAAGAAARAVILAHVKCSRQSVQTVGRNAKFLSSQRKAVRYFAVTAIRSTKKKPKFSP